MVMSRSRHAFFWGMTQAPAPKKVWNGGKVLMRHHEFEIFLPFSKFKMATFNDGYQADSERSDS